jgi:predicted nucleic acid-binding protein
LKRFVLDASVALAWFIDEPVPAEATRARRALLSGSRARVPSLWHLEMANGFAVAERRRILSAADVDQSLIHIEQLLVKAIETAEAFTSTRQALTTARAFGLSAYDATYLDLARSERLPLATLDKQLATAAQKVGVQLVR